MWQFLSGIWKFVGGEERSVIESFWKAVNRVIAHMSKDGGLYIEIPCSISDTVKWHLDPTDKSGDGTTTPMKTFTPGDGRTRIYLSDAVFRQVMTMPSGYVVFGPGRHAKMLSLSDNIVIVEGDHNDISKISFTTGTMFSVRSTLTDPGSLKYGSDEINFEYFGDFIEIDSPREYMTGLMYLTDYVDGSTNLDIEYGGRMLKPMQAEYINLSKSGRLASKHAMEIAHGNSIVEVGGHYNGVFENFVYKYDGTKITNVDPKNYNELFGVGSNVLVCGEKKKILSVSWPSMVIDGVSSACDLMIELSDRLPFVAMSEDVVRITRGVLCGVKPGFEVVANGVTRTIDSISGDVINLYKYNGAGVPKYVDSPVSGQGSLHIKYPTCKAVMYGEELVPVDSTVDVEIKEFARPGDTVTDCVDVIGDYEIIKLIPGAVPGKYMPVRIEEVE